MDHMRSKRNLLHGKSVDDLLRRLRADRADAERGHKKEELLLLLKTATGKT